MKLTISFTALSQTKLDTINQLGSDNNDSNNNVITLTKKIIQ